jgi:hypothetical protein
MYLYLSINQSIYLFIINLSTINLSIATRIRAESEARVEADFALQKVFVWGGVYP